MKKLIPKFIGFYFNILSYIYPKATARQGFILFCTPFAKKLKPHQKSFLKEAKHNILTVQDISIQTYKWGSGPQKVLLIHGWASHSFRWKSYIESLVENNYEVYAMDAPAHGLSRGKILNLVLYKDAIQSFLEKETNIQAIIGHSIGGFASLYTMYHQPKYKNIKNVIMGAPGEVKDFYDMFQKSMGLNKNSMKIMTEEFIRFAKKKPSDFSAPKFAKTLENPALIIHDKDDRDTKYEYSVNLNKAWKNSQLILTEGLGHRLKSKDLQNKVLDFLNN